MLVCRRRCQLEPRRLSIAVDDVRQRVRFRLGAAKPRLSQVIWTEGSDELLIHLDALKCGFADGWFVCDLELEAGGLNGRHRVQCVYFLGRTEQADGTRAAATLRPVGGAATAIADRWGRSLLRVIWDAVLDVIEGAVVHAGQQARAPMLLLGFSCTNQHLDVEVAPRGS